MTASNLWLEALFTIGPAAFNGLLAQRSAARETHRAGGESEVEADVPAAWRIPRNDRGVPARGARPRPPHRPHRPRQHGPTRRRCHHLPHRVSRGLDTDSSAACLHKHPSTLGWGSTGRDTTITAHLVPADPRRADCDAQVAGGNHAAFAQRRPPAATTRARLLAPADNATARGTAERARELHRSSSTCCWHPSSGSSTTSWARPRARPSRMRSHGWSSRTRATGGSRRALRGRARAPGGALARVAGAARRAPA
jgi:hypothetical protein